MLNEKSEHLKNEIQKTSDIKIDFDKYALSSLIRSVCEQFDVSKDEILNKRRPSRLVLPRHILYYLAYMHTGYTLPKLGALLNRDHTTILYAHDKVIQQKRKDKELALLIDHAHLLAITYETERQKRLTQYRQEVEEMIHRIKMERANGL